MNDSVRSEGIHGRDMLAFVTELPVRTVLNYQKAMILSKFHKDFPFLERKGLARRILEIRNHIQELYLLSLTFGIRNGFLITCSE